MKIEITLEPDIEHRFEESTCAYQVRDALARYFGTPIDECIVVFGGPIENVVISKIGTIDRQLARVQRHFANMDSGR